ncbi:MAG: recombinase family protein, partial [Cyanobacteria bacterium P01_H01_bin.119]
MPSDPDALSASSIPKTPLSGRAVAYCYSDPRLESPQPQVWGWELDQVYCDWATGDSAASNLAASNLTGDALSSQEPANAPERPQLAQLLQDCARGRVSYVLVRRLDELGESSAQVGQWLSQLEAAGVTVLATEQDYCSPPGASDTTAQSAFLKLLDEIDFYQRSRRIRQGHARNRLQGVLPPGKAPF